MRRVQSDGLLLLTSALALAACQSSMDDEAADPDSEVAAAESPPRTCATVEPTRSSSAVLAEIAEQGSQLESPRPSVGDAPAEAIAPVTIEVHFHVLAARTGEGELSDSAIRDQVQILDDAFAGTPFRFALAGITRTVKDSWFTMTPGSTAESAAKAILRRGSARHLNIYSASPAGGVHGWATLPSRYQDAPADDGVVVLYRSLPGGGGAPFDEGDTAVHEVGHWLGLLHTFHGGCTKHSDLVGDTPAEAIPAHGCPFGRDTCTGGLFPGRDPVENFMGFADDACMVLFTAGQAQRMEAAWATYRSGR
jgi:Pregnancy-associated plasma protein-A